MSKQTRTEIIKTYEIYDHNENLVGTYHNVHELRKDFNIRSETYIYESIRFNKFFKPSIKDNRYFKVKYSKEKREVPKDPNEPQKYYQAKNIKWFAAVKEKAIDLPGEEWREIPEYPNLYASNKGRFKYDKDDINFLLSVYSSTNKTKRVYHDVRLFLVDDDGTVISRDLYRSSRVIAKAWLDSTLGLSFKDDKRVVDHIDNNSENENVENLRILANNGENIKAAIYEQGRLDGKAKAPKKCYAYNVNSKEEREYNSTKELVADIWHKDNPGYFNFNNNRKSITKDGWRVGYNLEELKVETRQNSTK